jgi:uncharacterized protein (TIGR01777 family)
MTGSSGLIGSALRQYLVVQGHQVTRMVRRPVAAPDEIEWDPDRGTVGPGLEGMDAVVHLAGAGVGDRRWNKAYKQQILDSRVRGTHTLAQALARLQHKPSVLVSGSAIGFYGDSGQQPVTEASPKGTSFLADVVWQWEGSTQPAVSAGIRVVHARTGIVINSQGGAVSRLLPIFKFGLGGRVGSGNQYWSFISLRDEIRAIEFCISEDSIIGAVNLVAPHAVTNKTVTEAIANTVGRPAFLPVPAVALKAAVGEFAGEILASQNVVPSVLDRAGFQWLDPTITEALTSAES